MNSILFVLYGFSCTTLALCYSLSALRLQHSPTGVTLSALEGAGAPPDVVVTAAVTGAVTGAVMGAVMGAVTGAVTGVAVSPLSAGSRAIRRLTGNGCPLESAARDGPRVADASLPLPPLEPGLLVSEAASPRLGLPRPGLAPPWLLRLWDGGLAEPNPLVAGEMAAGSATFMLKSMVTVWLWGVWRN